MLVKMVVLVKVYVTPDRDCVLIPIKDSLCLLCKLSHRTRFNYPNLTSSIVPSEND